MMPADGCDIPPSLIYPSGILFKPAKIFRWIT